MTNEEKMVIGILQSMARSLMEISATLKDIREMRRSETAQNLKESKKRIRAERDILLESVMKGEFNKELNRQRNRHRTV